MLSCREVTRLVASDGLERARWFRRAQVRLHLLYCVHCRRYVRELQMIARAARRLSELIEPGRADALVQRVRHLIPQHLEAERHDDTLST